MQKYNTYKPSNVEWLGDVPSHWKTERIKDIANVVLGKMLCNEDKGNYHLKPYLKSKNIGWNELLLENVEEMWFSESELQTLRVKKDDILMTEGGEVGKTSIWNNELEECYIQNSVHKITFDKKNNPKYYLYLLNYIGSLGVFTHLVSTVSIGHLTKEKLVVVKVVVPFYPEQTAIANYLDQATANIDQVIATKQKQLGKLEQYKQSKIHECVTKGLNPDVSLKPSGIDWIGDVPSHWKTKRIKDIANLQSGNNITSEQITPKGEFPVYGGNGLRGYYNQYTHDGFYALIGRQGALCGNINYANGKFWASEHAVAVTIFEGSDMYWLGEVMREMNLNQYSQGSAQPGLAVENIKKLKIPFPPHKEQKEISKYLKLLDENISKEKRIINQQIEKLKQYRKSLIHECVTGKIKVTE